MERRVAREVAGFFAGDGGFGGWFTFLVEAFNTLESRLVTVVGWLNACATPL